MPLLSLLLGSIERRSMANHHLAWIELPAQWMDWSPKYQLLIVSDATLTHALMKIFDFLSCCPFSSRQDSDCAISHSLAKPESATFISLRCLLTFLKITGLNQPRYLKELAMSWLTRPTLASSINCSFYCPSCSMYCFYFLKSQKSRPSILILQKRSQFSAKHY